MAQTIKDYVLGVIGFTFLVVGSLLFMSAMYQGNPHSEDSAHIASFNKDFNKTAEVLAAVDSLSGSVTNTTAGNTDQGTFNGLIGASWNALKFIPISFTFMTNSINALSVNTIGLPIPSWAVAFAVAAITIIIIFAIFRQIFQGE